MFISCTERKKEKEKTCHVQPETGHPINPLTTLKKTPQSQSPERLKNKINNSDIYFQNETGKLVKDLSHLSVSFSLPKKNLLAIEIHHGARKAVASLRTVRTLINNLIIGVTRGFKYKMRYVYAHFPINVNIENNKETGLAEVEIRYG